MCPKSEARHGTCASDLGSEPEHVEQVLDVQEGLPTLYPEGRVGLNGTSRASAHSADGSQTTQLAGLLPTLGVKTASESIPRLEQTSKSKDKRIPPAGGIVHSLHYVRYYTMLPPAIPP